MSESKAMILGCSGKALTADEAVFFRGERPWGFILFARNIGEPDEVRDLVASLRDSVGRPDAPVFVDQEGGKVQRLRPPIAPNYPSAAMIGELYAREREAALQAAWLLGRLHAFDLTRLGINCNCLPVLDMPAKGASDVIGTRAYGFYPEMVAALGRATAEGSMAGGVLPVMKHIPGHGRATADSHLALPVVETPLAELCGHDFSPFASLADLPAAMTAHIVFTAVDPLRPATCSPVVVDSIIRGAIGFDGLLISDDTSMKALSGDFPEKAATILAAGCDLVLHCNGVMDEMTGLASRTTALEGKSLRRAEAALERVSAGDRLPETALRAEFAKYFDAVV